jgi:hypothetical protein
VRHEKRSVAALHEHLKTETGAILCHLQREVEIQTHSNDGRFQERSYLSCIRGTYCASDATKTPNMNTFEITGGVNIGWKHASYPFATLVATKEKIDVKVAIFGTYTFFPEDLDSIEAINSLFGLQQGLKFHHRIEKYSKYFIFWTTKKSTWVLEQIKLTGFPVPH